MRLIYADCHVHSNTSADASDGVAAACQAAVDAGLRRICFTNHYEISSGDPSSTAYLFDYDRYRSEIENARETFDGRLEILMGVEFGQPHRHPREFEAILARDFDMILGAVHALPLDFQLQWLWAEPEAAEFKKYLEERYLQEMTLMTAYGGFQAVAHFDWPKRFFPRFHLEPSAGREIFSNMKKNDIVLEINASAYERGCRWFYPSPEILASYLAAGHRRVTIGSDAHKGTEVGRHFDAVAAALRDMPIETGFFRKKTFIANSDEPALFRHPELYPDFSSLYQDHLWGSPLDESMLQEFLKAR